LPPALSPALYPIERQFKIYKRRTSVYYAEA
jgi:hypothetical protein